MIKLVIMMREYMMINIATVLKVIAKKMMAIGYDTFSVVVEC